MLAAGWRQLAGFDPHWQNILLGRQRASGIWRERARRIFRLVEIQLDLPVAWQRGVEESSGAVGLLVVEPDSVPPGALDHGVGPGAGGDLAVRLHLDHTAVIAAVHRLSVMQLEDAGSGIHSALPFLQPEQAGDREPPSVGLELRFL